MEKFLSLIKWDNKDWKEQDLKVKKVVYNQTNNTTLIFLETATILPLKVFTLLQMKTKQYNSLWDIKIVPKNSSSSHIFDEYLEHFLTKKTIGLELRNICHIKLQDQKILIFFNFRHQMQSYSIAKMEIQKYFMMWGFDAPVEYVLKENKELKKAIISSRKDDINKMRSNVVKKEVSSNSSSNLSVNRKYKINHNKFSREKIYNLVQEPLKNKVIEGKIFLLEKRLVKDNTLLIWKIGISDGKYSIFGKMFTSVEDKNWLELKEGEKYLFYGQSEHDKYERENIFKVFDCQFVKSNTEIKDIEKSRVEISAHTKMSAFDGIEETSNVINYALDLNHKGVILCDQDNVQSYPEIYKEINAHRDSNFKIGAGVILKVIEDELDIIKNPTDQNLDDASFIIFDFETTGLSSYYDEIIEFAAVKVKNNIVVDQTSFFIQTSKEIPPFIEEMTKINKDLLNQKGISQEEAAKKIKDFIGEDVLVAHNAQFDIGFLEQLFIKNYFGTVTNPWIDTVHLSWILTKPKKSYRLQKIAKEMLVKYDEELAHRAEYDVNVLQQVFVKMLSDAKTSFPDVIKISDLSKLCNTNFLTKQRGI